MSSTEEKIAKIQTHFPALVEIASTLNAASDEFTKTISVLDEALKQLNVGLTVWVSYHDNSDGQEDDPLLYDVDQIGYCKVNGTWGIALRHIWGDDSRNQFNQDGPWLFSEASRELRIRSVDAIPEVIEALAKEAFKITRRIQEKTKEVRELAGAINSLKDVAKAKAIKAVKEEKAKSLTLAERIAAGHSSLTGTKGASNIGDLLLGGDAKEGSK